MRNSHNNRYFPRILTIALFTVFLISCNRDRNNPGWEYFPDMSYSAAYKSYTKNPNFKDGMTMRTPAEGTVPRDFTPFEYTLAPESRVKAGLELVNPVIATPETISEGKKIYSEFCIQCHGAGGNGDGHLYVSRLYPLKPRSLVSDNAVKLKDGEIYHSITLGFGSMGAHGGQIRPELRWKLILYIRTLQDEGEGQIKTKKEAL